MTKSEFKAEHPYISDLINFAWDNDLYGITDYIYTDESIDEKIENDIAEFLRYEGWRGLLDYLNGIPTGYEYYAYNEDSWFDYTGLDESDYDEIFDRICDEYDEWEEESDEDEDEMLEAPTEEELAGLFSIGSGVLNSIP